MFRETSRNRKSTPSNKQFVYISMKLSKILRYVCTPLLSAGRGGLNLQPDFQRGWVGGLI